MMSLGVTAFIFDLTRPKLLQLGWFRWLYEHMLVWLAWAHGLVDPIKPRIRCGSECSRRKRAGRTLRLLSAHPPPDAGAGGGVTRSSSKQMHGVRREQPDRHEADADQAEPAAR